MEIKEREKRVKREQEKCTISEEKKVEEHTKE